MVANRMHDGAGGFKRFRKLWSFRSLVGTGSFSRGAGLLTSKTTLQFRVDRFFAQPLQSNVLHRLSWRSGDRVI
jgi:hypothetical protein